MTDIIEKECHNCGKKIYIQEKFVREQMYCTLGCMNESEKRNNHDSQISMINHI